MTNSRKKNVFLNVFIGYFSQIGIILLSFIGRKIFLHYLSIEYLGINGLYSNILTILSLPELGLDTAVVYFLYRPVADNDQWRISVLINYFKKTYMYLALGILAIGLSIAPVLQYIVNTDLPQFDLIIYYILFLLNTVISYFAAHNIALLSAHQEQRIQRLVSLITNIILQVLHIIILAIWKNYYFYVIATVLTTVINNLILSIACSKKHPILKEKAGLPSEEKRNIYKKVSATFIYKIGAVIINNTDNILLSVLVGTATVGLYSNYYTVVTAMQGFITIASHALVSSVGNLSVSSDRRKQKDVFDVMLVIYNIIAAIGGIGFYLLLNDFIVIWLGEKYLLDGATVFAISFSFYLTNSISPIWMYREANGLFEKVKYLILSTAGLNIILSIALGISYGAFGVLFATSISRLLTTFWYEPGILFKNVFMVSTKEYWFKQIKYMIVMLSSFCLCMFIFNYIPSGILWFAVKSVIVTVLTFMFFVLSCIKSKEVKYLLSIIKRR